MTEPAGTGTHPGAWWLGRRWLVDRGRLRVSTYVAMLYLGCVLGTYVGAAFAAADDLDVARFVLATVLLLVPALVGSRLWFVLGHLDAFRSDLRRVWRREEGGSALYGGLLLSAAVSVPVLAAFGLPWWRFWDAAAVTMLVGLVPTRLGCLANGCCRGRPTEGRFGVWQPDGSGRWVRRVPAPLLEAAWALAILAGVVVVGTDLPFTGARILAVVGLYAAGRVALAGTREGSTPAQRARLATALGLLVAVAAAWALRGSRP